MDNRWLSIANGAEGGIAVLFDDREEADDWADTEIGSGDADTAVIARLPEAMVAIKLHRRLVGALTKIAKESLVNRPAGLKLARMNELARDALTALDMAKAKGAR